MRDIESRWAVARRVVTTGLAALLIAGCGSSGPSAEEAAPRAPDPSALIAQYVERLNEVGDEQRAELQAPLRALRALPGDEVARAVEKAFEEAPADDFMARWSLVEMLRAVRTPAATALLARIARAPQPERAPGSADGLGEAELEVLVSVRALEGLRDLAVDGHAPALQALRGALDLPDRHRRVIAVQGLLDAGGRTAAAAGELRRILRPEDHWMLDLRPVAEPPSAEEVPR